MQRSSVGLVSSLPVPCRGVRYPRTPECAWASTPGPSPSPSAGHGAWAEQLTAAAGDVGGFPESFACAEQGFNCPQLSNWWHQGYQRHPYKTGRHGTGSPGPPALSLVCWGGGGSVAGAPSALAAEVSSPRSLLAIKADYSVHIYLPRSRHLNCMCPFGGWIQASVRKAKSWSQVFPCVYT